MPLRNFGAPNRAIRGRVIIAPNQTLPISTQPKSSVPEAKRVSFCHYAKAGAPLAIRHHPCRPLSTKLRSLPTTNPLIRSSCHPVILSSAFALLLTACTTTQPQIGPWAYQFSLGKFQDLRPNDDIMLMNTTPFTVEAFFASWQASVGRNLFANQPALLHVTLHEYQTTQSGTSYAVSMKTTLTGTTPQGQPLATLQASCAAAAPLGATEFATLTQQAITQADAQALTPAARSRTMWQKVFNTCIQQLATQFGQALAAGPQS